MDIAQIEKAIQELRKSEKRKFVQTVDLIMNLQKFDIKKDAVNTFIQLPHSSDKKICGLLTRKFEGLDVILKPDYDKFKDENEIKRLAKSYDFFIASASLMPTIATKSGRVFGPMGKMPSPQAGIMPIDDDNSIKANIEKMKKSVRVRTKEKSIKIAVGKEDMPDKDLAENIKLAVATIENLLTRKKDNVKNVMIKFTMTKAIKLNNDKQN
jgi:large subunit ribosomal protein L1